MKALKENKSLLMSLGLLLAVLVMASTFSFAQGKRGKDKGERKQQRAEMKAYMKSNILPVIAEKRRELDEKLTNEEKSELASIRSQMKAFREEKREMRKNRDRSQKPSEADIQGMREEQKQHRLLMDQAWEIVDRHEDQIYALMDELKPQAEQWKTDMKAIHEKYADETDASEKPHRRRGHRRGRKGFGHVNELTKPVRFLLFDSENWQQEMEKNEKVGAVRLYPNPGAELLTVSFEQSKSSDVKFTLFDSEGVKLKTLYEGIKAEGAQSIELDVQDLPAGIYYYELETSAGTARDRFVKK